MHPHFCADLNQAHAGAPEGPAKSKEEPKAAKGCNKKEVQKELFAGSTGIDLAFLVDATCRCPPSELFRWVLTSFNDLRCLLIKLSADLGIPCGPRMEKVCGGAVGRPGSDKFSHYKEEQSMVK